MCDRVGIIGTNFFIAIIDKILEIIAILSVIGDNFREERITIVEEIFSKGVVAITCTLCTYCSIATIKHYKVIELTMIEMENDFTLRFQLLSGPTFVNKYFNILAKIRASAPIV